MDSTAYLALSRQVALMRDMSVIANNVANLATTGFRGGQGSRRGRTPRTSRQAAAAMATPATAEMLRTRTTETMQPPGGNRVGAKFRATLTASPTRVNPERNTKTSRP